MRIFFTPFRAVLDSYVTDQGEPSFIPEGNTIQNANSFRVNKEANPIKIMQSSSLISFFKIFLCINRMKIEV